VGINGGLVPCWLAQMIAALWQGVGGAVEILGKYDRFLWVNQTGYGYYRSS